MRYKYNKIKLTCFILSIFTILPVSILLLLNFIVTDFVEELYVYVGLVWMLIHVFAVNEYTHELSVKKSKIIVTSLFFQKEICYDDVCEVKYSKIFRQLTLVTNSGENIFITMLYNDSNKVIEQIIGKMVHYNKQVPQELLSRYVR